MPKTKKEVYQQEICSECGQTTTKDYPMCKGTAKMLIKIHNNIELKKMKGQQPMINTRKEMTMSRGEDATLNVLLFHKLIKRELLGNYSITELGIEFLHGKEIPKTIIVKKGSHGEQIDWWRPDGMTSIKILLKDTVLWDGRFVKYSVIIKTEKDLEIAKQN